ADALGVAFLHDLNGDVADVRADRGALPAAGVLPEDVQDLEAMTRGELLRLSIRDHGGDAVDDGVIRDEPPALGAGDTGGERERGGEGGDNSADHRDSPFHAACRRAKTRRDLVGKGGRGENRRQATGNWQWATGNSGALWTITGLRHCPL